MAEWHVVDTKTFGVNVGQAGPEPTPQPCPKEILNVPTSAPPGQKVPVIVGVPDWAIWKSFPVTIEVWYAKGTGSDAYITASNKKGTKLGAVKLNKCQIATVGYITMPEEGVTIVAFASPADVPSGTLIASAKVKAGEYQLPKVDVSINAPSSVKAGGTLTVTVNARVLNDYNTHKFLAEMDTPFGTVKSGPVTTKGAYGARFNLPIQIPKDAKGTMQAVVKVYVDDQLAYQNTITVEIKPAEGPGPGPGPGVNTTEEKNSLAGLALLGAGLVTAYALAKATHKK